MFQNCPSREAKHTKEKQKNKKQNTKTKNTLKITQRSEIRNRKYLNVPYD